MKKMKRIYVTINALLLMQEDSDGHGLYYHSARSPAMWAKAGADCPYTMVKLVDNNVCEIANALRWSIQDAFDFMNSKLGRWAGDEICNSACAIAKAAGDGACPDRKADTMISKCLIEQADHWHQENPKAGRVVSKQKKEIKS